MQIIFRDCPPLNVQLDGTSVATKWLTLVRKNYLQDPFPLFRDPQKYTVERLEKLASEAKEKLGWSWNINDLSLKSTTLMHKDIEQFLANGYANIPEEYDELLHEIHFCLHSVESKSRRNSWLQIEWYNDDVLPLAAEDYPGKISPEFGDIRLQNPYVGHHPMYVYEQQDSINIMQTCKFHDLIKPGINIVIENFETEFDWPDYIDWWHAKGQSFIDQKGLDNLIKYTGHPIIGRITNLGDLEYCLTKPYLDFESLKFDM